MFGYIVKKKSRESVCTVDKMKPVNIPHVILDGAVQGSRFKVYHVIKCRVLRLDSLKLILLRVCIVCLER